MDRKDWYLLAYDIADPRRLKRMHYRMRREGVAVQQSVFLVQRNRRGMEQLLDELARLIEPAADDLRAYPVADPAEIWMRGNGIVRHGLLADAHIAAEGTPAKDSAPRAKAARGGWWRGLFGAGADAGTADAPAPRRPAAATATAPAVSARATSDSSAPKAGKGHRGDGRRRRD